MDSYTTSTPTTWLGTFSQSLGGLIFGPLLFIGSIVGLYYVESQTNYSKLAKNAPIFAASQLSPEAKNAPLVAVTGQARIEGLLDDGQYLIPANYLAYIRTTEIYAWEETKTISNQKDPNGNQIQQTTTSYHPAWTTTPAPTATFEHPEGHENPTEMFQAQSNGRQAIIQLEAYTASTNNLQLPAPEPLQLSARTVTVKPPAVLANNAIYTFATPQSSVTQPKIGDTRTTYEVVNTDKKAVTFFGKVQGTTIEAAHLHDIDASFEPHATFKRLFFSSPREAIAEMAHEYSQSLRIGRAIMFIFMLLSILMFLSPFSAFFSFIPIIGGFASAAVFFAALLASLACFAAALILLNMMLAPFYVLVILGALVGCLIAFLRTRRTS